MWWWRGGRTYNSPSGSPPSVSRPVETSNHDRGRCGAEAFGHATLGATVDCSIAEVGRTRSSHRGIHQALRPLSMDYELFLMTPTGFRHRVRRNLR
jgi:hypothetical protein